MISRATFVKSAPRFASLAPFWRLIVDHLECPDIGPEYTGLSWLDRRRAPRRGPDVPSESPPAAERTDRLVTMKTAPPPPLRGVALAGHAGPGKTPLGEQLLHRAGAVP